MRGSDIISAQERESSTLGQQLMEPLRDSHSERATSQGTVLFSIEMQSAFSKATKNEPVKQK